METLHLSSIFLITLLLLVGLVFFIRASVKDRTESLEIQVAPPPSVLVEQLQFYFRNRAYQLVSHDLEENKFILEGIVAPSFFLAGFLTVLAAIGFVCIALVLAILLPQFQILWIALPIFSPFAGVFYWRRAKRIEQVSFTVNPVKEHLQDVAQASEQMGQFISNPKSQADAQRSSIDLESAQSCITITAHRDELIAFRQALQSMQLKDRDFPSN